MWFLLADNAAGGGVLYCEMGNAHPGIAIHLQGEASSSSSLSASMERCHVLRKPPVACTGTGCIFCACAITARYAATQISTRRNSVPEVNAVGEVTHLTADGLA
ncbi:uncharacterized protein [Triticum aestivum]|uniref:uncharacterized protein n=1 Tax=Triticum aestivum TaxID=4565 RepID=UPI001D00CE2D|nr:uncharacterized protein LOC123085467 [Triticum aestivum]